MRRPRAMVLDEEWRRLDGVEPLSGPHGGPLSRTVKLILDPLVIRPVQNPACAGPIVTADGAMQLAARLHAGADVLRATAAWFTLLKKARRAARITEGNPQDLYFQRCFELATTSGMPDPLRDMAIADATLREIHEYPAGRTTAALKEYLTDRDRAGELTARLRQTWQHRPAPAADADHAALIASLLDGCAAAALDHDNRSGQMTFDALVDADAGAGHGARLWTATAGHTAKWLGLTAHRLPRPPELSAPGGAQSVSGNSGRMPVEIGSSSGKAESDPVVGSATTTPRPGGDPARRAPDGSSRTHSQGLPFDRTVYERIAAVLKAGERAELPPIADLVAAEIARSCAPWALLDEPLRVSAAAGAALALGLRPIDRMDPPTTAETLAQRVINRRWQREAYVLQARRLALSPDADALPAANPLAVIAAELRTPWRSYLRRLWVRLHGRDVRELSVDGPAELWDLLAGVARSVMLDHRMRVKQALAVNSLEQEPDSTESRAS